LPYFKERGILESTIKEFQLGFCQDEWDAFAKEATTKQYNEEYLIELGLAIKSEKTGNLIDRFRGRVMFPINNPVGKVIGFGGRILGNKKEIAKYINSPQSPIYHKSQVLYGMHLAKKHIRDKDLCILTEGYMDTIVLHQNDIRNVVASSGTALTPDQIRLIRRFTHNVLMIYDGDQAGIKAALRGIDLLLKENMGVNLLILPDNHDPDSYVTEFGAKAFLDLAEKEALSFLDFKMRVMKQGGDINDPRFQAELIKGLAETIGNIPDRIQRQMYIKHVAQEVDITEALMTHAVDEARKEIGKLEAREKKREEARQQAEAPAEVKELKGFEKLPLANQEQELLRVILNYYDKTYTDYKGPKETPEGEPIEPEGVPLVEYMMVELEGLSFENELYEIVKLEIFSEFSQTGKININNYLNHENDDIRKTVTELLIVTYEISPGWRKNGAYVTDLDGDLQKTLEGAVYHYKSKKIDRLLIECKAKLKEAHETQNAEESDRLLEFFMYLNNMRKEIFKKLGTEGAIGGGDGRL
ncbi:MAG: DNA primase, partial [Bacteroidetes bacterium]|nr:DNA primase [Bacteroidota bacterium]